MRWRSLDEFPDYIVSESGYVARGAILLKQTPDRDGYLLVNLRKPGKRRMAKVHQLVLEAFVGPKPKGLETRHLNGKRTDNRLENLAWGTHRQNVADCVAHGTASGGSMKGTDNPAAKLTMTEIAEIRCSDLSAKVLALRYGVHRSTVYRVRWA